jgi:hypothetical protein
MKTLESSSNDDTFLQKIQREGVIWATLKHPNILPLLGFAEDEALLQSLNALGVFVSPASYAPLPYSHLIISLSCAPMEVQKITWKTKGIPSIYMIE